MQPAKRLVLASSMASVAPSLKPKRKIREASTRGVERQSQSWWSQKFKLKIEHFTWLVVLKNLILFSGLKMSQTPTPFREKAKVLWRRESFSAALRKNSSSQQHMGPWQRSSGWQQEGTFLFCLAHLGTVSQRIEVSMSPCVSVRPSLVRCSPCTSPKPLRGL